MLGPKAQDERSRPREAVNEGWTRGVEEERREADAECELCEEEKPTSVAYGLQVCRGCEVELLP